MSDAADKRGQLKRCECEHAKHFIDGAGAFDSQLHRYGASCTHVIRAGQGLLICAACAKAGHAPRAEARAILRDLETP